MALSLSQEIQSMTLYTPVGSNAPVRPSEKTLERWAREARELEVKAGKQEKKEDP